MNADFGDQICAPLAFTNVTAGDGVSAAQAYCWWYERLQDKMTYMGIKLVLGQDGVAGEAVLELLRDLNGGSISEVPFKTGWLAFSPRLVRRKVGARRIEGVNRFEGERFNNMKRTFMARVWLEGEWHIAEAFEVGIASQGTSEQEALDNLREGIELYYEELDGCEPDDGCAFKVHAIEAEIGGD